MNQQLVLMMVALMAAPAAAAGPPLKQQTVAAFDRYVALTEKRIAAEVASTDRFVFVDTLTPQHRHTQERALREGRLVIERLQTRDQGRAIEVTDGLIHHWVGLSFVPGATADEAVALLQDYERHPQIYNPAIADARILSRDGDTFRVFLRFFQKKGLTVVINSEHDARFTRLAPGRAHSRVVSTRIAEVEHPGTPREREKPVGHDGGYLWRLNTYWRFLERDGGTYVQCESVSLTRSIPLGLGWLIGPFVTSIPKESLEFTMAATRRALTAQFAPVD